jgi:hypothetical protein
MALTKLRSVLISMSARLSAARQSHKA